ncbi:hypothetical protein ACIBHX_48835 [Nonomuraea sp. NPDC050536]|uniref:hypothetical protein n=1 Tax=Nonomuraea sp. NPDC050536 TaxID=3364366 RepID=UPI0037CA2EB4
MKQHPIITCGNGTNAVPTQYSGVLNQLASWGFVVISPNSAIQGYYDKVPGAAAKALLKGAGHNTVQGTGGGFLG